MNLKKLESYQKQFFMQYPGGFENPVMQDIGKKHKMSKMIDLAQRLFAKDQFKNEDAIIAAFAKVVGQSSMVSVFEKAKLRDYLKTLYHEDKQIIVQGLYELIHGKMELGFELLVDQLGKSKLAKWTIITAVLVYYKPNKEFFVKPTTAKKIIKHFNLDLTYRPLPSFAFYKKFRTNLNAMKKHADPKLSPNNAAFTGFLMMTMG